MDPTITQNSALYLAHRKVSKRRATLFRWLRGPDAQRQLDLHGLIHRTTSSSGQRAVSRFI